MAIKPPPSIFTNSKSNFIMNKQLLLLTALLFSVFLSFAQQGEVQDTSWKKIYRATPEKKHSLIHTKLEAGFDIPNAYLNGKVWITLKPHFYATNELELDAKGMDINEVAMVKAQHVPN